MSETETPVENHPCAGCGQLDDHPMVHTYGPWQKQVDEGTLIVESPSFHHDCLPQEFREMLGDSPQHAVCRAAIAAAESGTHGDALRAFIQAQESDNDLEPQGV